MSWLNCEQHGKNQYKKKEHNQHSSVFKVLRWLSYYFNGTDPLIIPTIFIFLSCRGKAHDNKELHHENSKPSYELPITTTGHQTHRPSQIVCTVTTMHIMCTQLVLHVHKNLCTLLIFAWT